MKEYWDQLRPLEKRLVVIVGTALFIVLNAWFVVPHFSDWNTTKARMFNAQRDLKKFQDEIAHVESVETKKVKNLEDGAGAVPLEDQSANLQSTVRSEADKVGVGVQNFGQINTRTNDPFFVEKVQILSAQSKEQPLVDFLYNLGSGNSLIRVRSLGLKADPSHQQLQASITLVASYQKKPAPKNAAPVATSQPAAKTAVMPKSASPTPGTPASSSTTSKVPVAPNSKTTAPIRPASVMRPENPTSKKP